METKHRHLVVRDHEPLGPLDGRLAGGSGSREQAKLKRGSLFTRMSQPLSWLILRFCRNRASSWSSSNPFASCYSPQLQPPPSSHSPSSSADRPFAAPPNPNLSTTPWELLLHPPTSRSVFPPQHPSPPPILFHFYLCAWRALGLSTVCH